MLDCGGSFKVTQMRLCSKQFGDAGVEMEMLVSYAVSR